MTTTNTAYSAACAGIAAEIDGYRHGGTPAHVADERATAAADAYAASIGTPKLIDAAGAVDLAPLDNIAPVGMMMRRQEDPDDIINAYVRVALRDALTDRMMDHIGDEATVKRLEDAGAYALSLTNAEAGAIIATVAREIFATGTE